MGIQNLLIVSATALLVACGGGSGGDGGSGGGGSPTPAKFSVAVAPASVTVGQGQEVAVEIVIVRDAGFTEPISVTLNQPAAGITADTLLLSGSRDRGFLPIRVAPDLAAGSVHRLDVMGTAGGAAQVVSSNLTVSAPQPYTSKKIATALNAGTLDYETSLLYRAYAFFEDKRLPEAYLGAGTVEDDNLIFDEIRAGFANLSITAQDALRPFIVRPADARSVWNTAVSANKVQATSLKKAFPAASTEACPVGEAGSWISKRSLSYPVRVWAQCRGEVVNDSENVMLIDKTLAVLNKIYAPMTGLMGEPRPDVEGDDNAIDVYILNDDSYVHRRDNDIAQKQGATAHSDDAQTPVGKGASGFITVARTLLYNQRFNITMIHELFHVLQFAHNAEFSIRPIAGTTKTERHWFSEASASWAAAHFDRTLAPWDDGRAAWIDVHRMFTQFFLPSFEALNTIGGPHPYSAYIWPYFVEQETGSTDFMKNIWIGLETVSTFEAADQAIDNAYSFATNFKHFALRNINTELIPGDPLPQVKRYVKLDPEQFVDDKKEPPYLSGTLVGNQAFSQDFELKNLSARYVRLTVAAASPAARQVVVDISGLQPASELDVQALVRTDDGWLAQPIDISPAKVTFCFDKGPTTASVRGSFQEILLVVSNHAIAKGTDISGTLKVQPKSAPCSTGWAGTIKQVIHNDTPFGNTTITTRANVTFEFDEVAAATTQPGEIPFKLRNGTFSYDMLFESIGRSPACRTIETGNGALPLDPYQPLVPAGTAAGLRVFPKTSRYEGSGASVVTITNTSNCNDSNVDMTTVDPIRTVFWWPGAVGDVSTDGLSIRHVYTVPGGSFDVSLDQVAN
jgi:hypothetical protein